MDFKTKLDKCLTLFESRDKLISTLDSLAKKTGVTATIIGGAALSKYNYNRVTEDIDLLTTVNDAYKLGDELLANGFEFIGRSKFLHNSGIFINFCPEGVQAGHQKFPAPEPAEPGLHFASLPLLLSLKIKAKRLKDRGDFAELVKRNDLDIEFIRLKVFPFLNEMDRKWAVVLFNQAKLEAK